MTSSKIDPAETALIALLDVLASLLIALDITPLRLAQIARASFVKAGAGAARKHRSGRPHIARIAALTGLSRTEVKRIVSANYSVGQLEPEHSPRALRVLSAWRQSVTRNQKTRLTTLKIVGPAPSFESICRQFSGDIPFRVILAELLQRRSVHLARGKKAVSIAKSIASRPGRQRDLNTLLYGASFFSELVSADRILVRRKEKIVAPTNISTAYVEEATAQKVSAFLDHLPKIFASKNQRKRAGLNVYALVSRPKRNS